MRSFPEPASRVCRPSLELLEHVSTKPDREMGDPLGDKSDLVVLIWIPLPLHYDPEG